MRLKILLNVLIILFFTFVYFTLMSFDLFPTVAQFFPSIYYPLGIVLSTVIISLFNKAILKSGNFFTTSSSFIGIAFLILFSWTINSLFGSILFDYYRHSPVHNLLKINQYIKQKGNYGTIYKSLLKNGVFAYSIDSGYPTSFKKNKIIAENRNNYTEVIYQINYDSYIIYDWTNNSVVCTKSRNDVINDSIEYLNTNYNAEIKKDASLKTKATALNVIIKYYAKTYLLNIFPSNNRISFSLDDF
ncbi:hypothetical protein ACPUYX_11975 [Desulfosporosinus sp. SYSU MS00001]|uniref:hypothetical protein n=1 Tax=Desulfosporosinus sp. SYSU MS00001 TaxID=3416284 RepID=UPI003CF5F0A7